MSSSWTSRTGPNALSRARNIYAYAPAWDEANSNDDHGRPGREDYSIHMVGPGQGGATVAAATLPAWTGPWAARLAGTTASGIMSWTVRATGGAATAVMSWTERAAGETTSPSMSWVARRGGTTTTTTITWTGRASGTATS